MGGRFRLGGGGGARDLPSSGVGLSFVHQSPSIRGLG
jgi:hypothetical protein